MLKDYYLHICQIFKRLQKARILVNIYKYNFYY